MYLSFKKALIWQRFRLPDSSAFKGLAGQRAQPTHDISRRPIPLPNSRQQIATAPVRSAIKADGMCAY
jgi:hypothetical protein